MQQQQGFTLLEVLVAWLIVSTVLLSVSWLQLKQTEQLRHSDYVSVATLQLQSLVERLRVNHHRGQELALWQAHNAEVLPSGRGRYHCGQGLCRVTVIWQEQNKQQLSLAVPDSV